MSVGPFFMFPESQANLMAIAQKRRDELAAKRAKKAIEDRRVCERRLQPFDRRMGDRRQFATMDDKLAAEAKRGDERKYSGDRLSGFGDSTL